MKVLIFGAATTKGLSAFGINKCLYGGGWVENLVDGLSKEYDVDLYLAFFLSSIKKVSIEKRERINYIAIPQSNPRANCLSNVDKKNIKIMLELAIPDVVHIIGTEREASYELFKNCNKDHVVVSITGMVSVYAKHYYGQIDKQKLTHITLGDFLRNTSPKKGQKRFERQGKNEITLLANAKHVMGRTRWDYACTKMLNPNVDYIYCSEVLNPTFSANTWNLDKCERHSIFISQANYPIKGLHRMFEALADIIEIYPDAMLYIAGENIWGKDTFVDKIKQGTYATFLYKLAQKLNLPMDQIKFTGLLLPEEMKEHYLKSNVFVMPSIIENSPNSLGEAMSLGVPCVASYVGGIPDMVIHGVDGYLYASDEPYMLAHYICKIFKNENEAIKIGENARNAALKRFNDKTTLETTYQTYLRLYQV